MMRYNANIREERSRRQREMYEAEWAGLFDQARVLAETGPLANFRVDLCHVSTMSHRLALDDSSASED
jgi:hypothetical protein